MYPKHPRHTVIIAIAAIISNSVKQQPNSPTYNLSVGTTGNVTDGPFTLFLVDPSTHEVFTAAAGSTLQPADLAKVTVDRDKVTAAEGYTLLNPKQVNTASTTINALDIAISFDETDASGTTSPGVDSIEF